MKKDNNILYFGLFFAASVLAEIFCIVEGINIIGVSIVVWIATYLVIDAYRTDKAKYYKHMEDTFIERLNELEKIEKALYVQMKKNAEFTEERLKLISDERKAGVEGMIDSQNKSAKIIVKYVREDLKKASAIDKANCEKISSTIHQGINRIIAQKETNSFDSKEITNSLDSNFSNLIERMENRMKDIEKECVKLEQISDNLRLDIKGIQMGHSYSVPIAYNIPTQESGQKRENKINRSSTIVSESSTLEQSNLANANLVDTKTEDINTKDGNLGIKEEVKPDDIIESVEVKDQYEEMQIEEKESQKEVASEERVQEKESVVDNANLLKSEELINADLLSEAAASKESSTANTEDHAVESTKESAVTNEPNKQLNADEIAALFAAAEEESKDSADDNKEEPSEEITMDESSDPNRQLSADEIASMFAAIGDSNKEEQQEPVDVKPAQSETKEEKNEAEESKKESEGVDLSDPNKQLSAEEIAALFASMG